MRIRVSRVPLFVGLAFSAMVAAPSVASASTISLNTDPTYGLTNISFEGGVQANGCPVGWVCSTNGGTAEWTVNSPTSAEYPLDPTNGLASGFVPSGSKAAITPVIGSTSTLTQTLTGVNWVAGNDYTLSFWLGNPLGAANADFPDTVSIAFLTGTTSPSSMCDGDAGRSATLTSGALSLSTGSNSPCQFNLSGSSLPTDGDWRQYLFTFHFVGGSFVPIGPVAVQFTTTNSVSALNNEHMNLDLVGPATPVPEPASLALLGTGLFAAAAARRRVQRRK